EEFIDRLKNTKAENYREESVAFVKDIIAEVYAYCAGFYISTPLKKTEYVCDIIKHINSLEGYDGTQPRS
ncbi:hypothetical protein LJB88_05520, partial [Erysipelotrichaceae bacterium OttesenSCG-928-M19]|nr:hypothetical protein [Erysipelotrichaceae bacterium OttesenSCG-928-M19]